jgi:hypothetical protein
MDTTIRRQLVEFGLDIKCISGSFNVLELTFAAMEMA